MPQECHKHAYMGTAQIRPGPLPAKITLWMRQLYAKICQMCFIILLRSSVWGVQSQIVPPDCLGLGQVYSEMGAI
eukprot:6172903-Pleurochrysis_carterae.AAC.1